MNIFFSVRFCKGWIFIPFTQHTSLSVFGWKYLSILSLTRARLFAWHAKDWFLCRSLLYFSCFLLSWRDTWVPLCSRYPRTKHLNDVDFSGTWLKVKCKKDLRHKVGGIWFDFEYPLCKAFDFCLLVPYRGVGMYFCLTDIWQI